MKSKFCTRDESALAEATARPIFLLQSRRWQVVGAPDGFDFFEDGACLRRELEGGTHSVPILDENDEPVEELSPEELSQRTFGEWDTPCAFEAWNTERVFLTRQEGESYGAARSYNFPDGWRVYCIPCEGELAEAIEDGTEIPGNRASRQGAPDDK